MSATFNSLYNKLIDDWRVEAAATLKQKIVDLAESHQDQNMDVDGLVNAGLEKFFKKDAVGRSRNFYQEFLANHSSKRVSEGKWSNKTIHVLSAYILY